ncbi:hypothetical protein BDZ90DRAFT_233298 [Jaminaea rosea]|uniref:Putative lipoate-protein ligase A n=1 Tax=Jaminaea rosea TaxID=1569628 RepID=A0A316UQL2_9BASI|nr:hypothetical protein BDZ90DRAFT_233298 [Jaminaea rosea]PWN26153.1 hypothetical protein BDZ90DRAFT_233298 [Jaminaea rosea]
MGAEMIARALNGPGVGLRTLRSDEASPPAERFAIGQGSPEGAYVNERHDLVVRVVDQAASSGSHESHWAERKISGSAFKILTHRAYHHGTMLLSSDLSALGSSLRNVKTNAMKSKGVESVKSPVVNLSAAYPSAAKQGRLDHEKFTRAVVREFWNTYDAESGRDEARGGSVLEELGRGWVDVHEDLPLAKEPERVKLEKLLGEWDWIYASCPEFEVVIQAREYKGKGRLRELGLGEGAALKVHCKNGIVLNAEMEGGDGDEWEQVVKGIVGQRYDTFAECPPMPGGSACAREEVSGDARRRRAIEALGEHDQQIKTALVEWLHEAL